MFTESTCGWAHVEVGDHSVVPATALRVRARDAVVKFHMDGDEVPQVVANVLLDCIGRTQVGGDLAIDVVPPTTDLAA